MYARLDKRTRLALQRYVYLGDKFTIAACVAISTGRRFTRRLASRQCHKLVKKLRRVWWR